MDSSNPGSLTVTGGHWSSGIGGSIHEESGKITINGGVITAKACGKENQAENGGACGSGTNAGHAITINGGTLIPTTTSTGAFYAVGADGGLVIVTGGSFPVPAKSGGYDNLSFKGSGVYAADRATKLTLVKINVSAQTKLIGKQGGNFDVYVDGAKLATEYDLAYKIDDEGILYFWLPANAATKEVSIENVRVVRTYCKIPVPTQSR